MDTQIDYQALAKALMVSMKDAGTTPNVFPGHGPGGAFSTPGIGRDWMNAMVLPKLGLLPKLRVRPSNELSPLHAILTGVTDVSGSHPSGQCDPCKIPGNVKRCITSTVFGRFCLSTRTIDLSGDLGAINNRGEFRDFRLIGNPFENGIDGVAPSVPGAGNGGNVLNSEVAKMMFEFKVGWAREYGRKLYDANPTNNSGSYKEFRGLNLLINTGYQDAEMGTLCPAADSLIRNFNLNITGNGPAIVNELTGVWRRQNKIASDAGLQPVGWTWVMPEMLFYELTAVWPCAYNSYRCVANANGATPFLDAEAQRRMVDEMRAGQYLLIDGQKTPVTLDDGLAETAGENGEFTSQIMLIPLTVLGVDATYIEYYNFDNDFGREARNLFGIDAKYMTTDAGRFLWVRRTNGFCVSMDAVERSRVLLDAPFLAVRITNVKYTPLIQTRSGWTDAGERYYDGGVYQGIPAPSFYAPNIYA
ncbi:MAG: hypothetical protein IT323_13495 [Anaerolineae bacterium]|nr:hypothetical protein [Anaerolineae bacterium]